MYGYRDPADYVNLTGLGARDLEDTYRPEEVRYVAPEVTARPGQVVVSAGVPMMQVPTRLQQVGRTTVVRDVSGGQASRPSLPRSNIEAQLAEAKRKQAANIAAILKAQQQRAPVTPKAEVPTTTTRQVVEAAAKGATPIVTTKMADVAQVQVEKKALGLARLRSMREQAQGLLDTFRKQAREFRAPVAIGEEEIDEEVPPEQARIEKNISYLKKNIRKLDKDIENEAYFMEKKAAKAYIAPDEMRPKIKVTAQAQKTLAPVQVKVEQAVEKAAKRVDSFDFSTVGAEEIDDEKPLSPEEARFESAITDVAMTGGYVPSFGAAAYGISLSEEPLAEGFFARAIDLFSGPERRAKFVEKNYKNTQVKYVDKKGNTRSITPSEAAGDLSIGKPLQDDIKRRARAKSSAYWDSDVVPHLKAHPELVTPTEGMTPGVEVPAVQRAVAPEIGPMVRGTYPFVEGPPPMAMEEIAEADGIADLRRLEGPVVAGGYLVPVEEAVSKLQMPPAGREVELAEGTYPGAMFDVSLPVEFPLEEPTFDVVTAETFGLPTREPRKEEEWYPEAEAALAKDPSAITQRDIIVLRDVSQDSHAPPALRQAAGEAYVGAERRAEAEGRSLIEQPVKPVVSTTEAPGSAFVLFEAVSGIIKSLGKEKPKQVKTELELPPLRQEELVAGGYIPPLVSEDEEYWRKFDIEQAQIAKETEKVARETGVFVGKPRRTWKDLAVRAGAKMMGPSILKDYDIELTVEEKAELDRAWETAPPGQAAEAYQKAGIAIGKRRGIEAFSKVASPFTEMYKFGEEVVTDPASTVKGMYRLARKGKNPFAQRVGDVIEGFEGVSRRVKAASAASKDPQKIIQELTKKAQMNVIKQDVFDKYITPQGELKRNLTKTDIAEIEGMRKKLNQTIKGDRPKGLIERLFKSEISIVEDALLRRVLDDQWNVVGSWAGKINKSVYVDPDDLQLQQQQAEKVLDAAMRFQRTMNIYMQEEVPKFVKRYPTALEIGAFVQAYQQQQ